MAGDTSPAAPSLDHVFERERAETVRARLRMIFPAAVVVLLVSFVLVDGAAFTRAQAVWIRAPECAVSIASWWWLRRPRSLRAIETLAVSVWGVVVTAAAYGILVVPEAMLTAKVTGHVLSALSVCLLASLSWRATAVFASFSFLILGALKLRHADTLLTLTMTTTGFAYGIVVASAAARDRSKRAELSARLALVEANERLARDDELRRRLFVNLSHDLRTPLAVVRGDAALLRASGRFAEDDASLYRVEANARALADLAEQLLDLARLDAGEMPLRKRRCDVGRAARDVAALLEMPGKQPIAAIAPASPIVALADPSQIVRILSNLVANARRHSADDVAIVVRREGDRVIVDVVDGGPGVPPERREAIFRRFVSFDSDGSTASGIGIPLARELAVHNAGTLELVVDAAKTTFRLVLPAGDGPADDDGIPDVAPVKPPARVVATSADGPVDPHAPTLLVVEDSDDMAALLVRVLGPHFRVARVARVSEALEHLATRAPDAVLSDVLLPDGSGYEVLAAVRAGRELVQVPVVLLSALGEVEQRVRGLAAGADDYVAKPFAPEELVGRVTGAMDRARSRRLALEAQREGLLMEIHDGVSASLARAAMLLASAAPDGGGESVAFARDAIADGLDEVRAITRLLAPRAADWQALAGEIRRAMADACAGASLALDFSATEDETELTVPAALAHTLRRVAREATTNAIKHARARTLSCRLVATAEHLRLTIGDDGVGLSGGTGEGRGLGIMRRRVARAGGEIAIDAAPGGGARIVATFPRSV